MDGRQKRTASDRGVVVTLIGVLGFWLVLMIERIMYLR